MCDFLEWELQSHMCVVVGDALVFWLILLNWIESSQIKKIESIFEFPGKKIIESFFELNIPEKNYNEKSFELNSILKWMTESYFEFIFAIFLSILDTFWALFLFHQYQWFQDYWIELHFELNQQNFFWIE